MQDGFGLDRTLDLASTLEGGNDLRMNGDAKGGSGSGQMRSVLTIAFQFAYEVHTRDTCAAMARQYVRTVVASVQRVAMALAPSRGAGPGRQVPSNPDALSLARHVLSSYRWVFQLMDVVLVMFLDLTPLVYRNSGMMMKGCDPCSFGMYSLHLVAIKVCLLDVLGS